MNGLTCLILIHALILLRWRGKNHLNPWLVACQTRLQRIEAREYSFEGLASDAFAAVFHDFMARGYLQPQSIRTLMTWIRALQKSEAARQQLGQGTAFRLILAAGLALLSGLAIDGQWFLRLSDNPFAFLLIVGEALILALWLRRLPSHPLADSQLLQIEFTAAWLGHSRQGPWQAAWMQVAEHSQLTGRDGQDAQRQLLEDWLQDGIQAQEKRLSRAEDLFGLVELAGSVYFLGTACALPLLNFWSV